LASATRHDASTAKRMISGEELKRRNGPGGNALDLRLTLLR
jgi:hypothetical protein